MALHAREPPKAIRLESVKLEPPEQMLGHLHGVGLPGRHPTSVDVGWRPCALRHETDRIDGYELEAAEVCFLDGQKPFNQVYRGSLTVPLT